MNSEYVKPMTLSQMWMGFTRHMKTVKTDNFLLALYFIFYNSGRAEKSKSYCNGAPRNQLDWMLYCQKKTLDFAH